MKSDPFREFQAELRRLHEQDESERRRKRAEAFHRIVALMDEHDLYVEDLGFGPVRQSAGKVPPKYRDPVTGATWSGRGRPPAWIVGKDRTTFAIA